ncbi:hypothetical protein SLNHY_3777 [Streptomyces albus]|nr:hypothetical protein SLNHY_3777 [Streptomyces albus]
MGLRARPCSSVDIRQEGGLRAPRGLGGPLLGEGLQGRYGGGVGVGDVPAAAEGGAATPGPAPSSWTGTPSPAPPHPAGIS